MRKKLYFRLLSLVIALAIGLWSLSPFVTNFSPPKKVYATACPSVITNDGTYTLTAAESGTLAAGTYDCSAYDVVINGTADSGGAATWTWQGDTVGGTGVVMTVNSLNVHAGGSITASGQGFAGGTAGNGSGTGGGAGANSGGGHAGAGGGHGGNGSDGLHTGETPAFFSGGTTYGSRTAPVTLGSGGGVGGNGAVGGAGGGAIQITATGTITVSGSITANGGDGAAGGGAEGAGAGSGGSIYLIAATLAGSGSITANGGAATGNGGGGGGGRIALHYTSSNTSSYTITTSLGSGTTAGGGVGEGGSSPIIDDTNNDLYITTSQLWHAKTSEGSSATYRDITLSNNSTWTIAGYYTTNSDGVGITLNARNVTIGSGSSISSNSKGYTGGSYLGTNGSGTGGGTANNSGCNGAGGGGYGGAGAAGSGGTFAGGGTYGSSTAPVDLGSGGGGSTCSNARGGNGGGAIAIVASGTVTVTGSITANGEAGQGNVSAGGSGGSIYITAATIAGGGSITADGGMGGASGQAQGAGGGGGRISLKYSTAYTFNGTTTAALGLGPLNTSAASAGTITTAGTPSVSTPLQYQSGGLTEISTGGTSTTTTVVLKMTMSDGDATDTLTPKVEVQPIGTSFTNTATNTGTGVSYTGTPLTGSVTVTGLTDLTSYHWQAQVCDAGSNCTAWSSYGGNLESATDFAVLTNQTPTDPTSLGPSNLVDGSYTTDNTPTLTFSISDPDTSDNVQYQIIIDDTANFSSAVVNYTSAVAVEPYSGSFTVGQAAGSGTYTTGSAGQTLSDGSYYWEVRAIDDSAAASNYSVARSGSVAFIVDATSPSTPGTPSTTSPTMDTTPTWTWTASTDGGSGLAGTPYTLQWSTDSTFVSGVSSTTSTTNSFTHSTALTDGTWYMRIKASDSGGNDSSWSTSGTVVIDTTAPASFSLESPGDGDFTNSERPNFRWKATTDSGSGLSSYRLSVNNGDSGSFSVDGISPTGTSDVDTSQYHIHYEGFSDSDSNNNYISVYTKSNSAWGDNHNDGKLKEGSRSWSVTAYDTVGNERNESRTLKVDFSSPSISISQLTYSTSQVKVTGTLTDSKAGSNQNKGDYVRSNPSRVTFSIKRDYTLFQTEVTSLNLSLEGTCNYSDSTSDSLSCSYAPTFLASFPAGNYILNISGYDKAGNSTSYSTRFQVSTSVITKASPRPSSTPRPTPTATPKASGFATPTPEPSQLPEPTASPVDRTIITNIQIKDITLTSARITWDTNEPATSKVNFGLSTKFERNVYETSLVTHHEMILDNLPQHSDIYFEVISEGTTTAYDAYRIFQTEVTRTPFTILRNIISNIYLWIVNSFLFLFGMGVREVRRRRNN